MMFLRVLDLNFDGLMIETHVDPDSLSDAAQQILSSHKLNS